MAAKEHINNLWYNTRMEKKFTQKQEKAVNERASRFFADSKIRSRLKELQDGAQKRTETTLDNVVKEIEETCEDCKEEE